MRKLLNEQNIKKAHPGDELWDKDVPGLHLRIFKSGNADYYLYYRTRQGQQRKPKLGPRAAYTLDEVRNRAKKMLGDVADGQDPAIALIADRQAMNMSELWAEIWEAHYSDRNKVTEKTGDASKYNWEKYLSPRLSTNLVRDIDYKMLDELHKSMKETPIVANRCLALLSVMLKHAERLGWRPVNSNPVGLVKRFPEVRIERFVGDKDEDEIDGETITDGEAKRIWDSLRTFESAAPASVAFIKLVIFTGARPGEIAAAKWEWLKDDLLTIPADSHKTGRKTKKERLIVLPPPAMEAIAKLPRTNGTLTGIQDPKTVWVKVREMAGIKRRLRFYDLRHTFGTTAANDCGFSNKQTGNVLGHTQSTTTDRYIHKKRDVLRMVSYQTAKALEAMLTGVPVLPPGGPESKVVPIRKSA